ncbi:hypothetical protein BJ138DRAFT_1018968 [Hygrophoropsis aurantiaca]|uniref:Uncharacterized protein n=1 Tax=Hygrophoropsis aurantiaca TaxID=72124 RepID=A0ACB7ZTM6_9AGAM|nr:hypothetical protein BJ138DRAFT_1018968 [Hygrophoropsis aurantiaca]
MDESQCVCFCVFCSKGFWLINPRNASSFSPQLSELEAELSLAERRPRRLNRRLPERFRDMLPEPPLSVPANPEATSDTTRLSSAQPPFERASSVFHVGAQSVRSCISHVVQTRCNVFGLFRRYFRKDPPPHDPEDLDLSYRPSEHRSDEHPSNLFYPYPNESSFHLGNWYWNQGAQKSQQSFKQLLDIVGNANFQPEDVWNTQWKAVNRELGHNDFDSDDGEWLDDDESWKKTPVFISVPFHTRTKNPGVKEHHAVDLHHRSLVSIMREKLSNPEHARLFHYDPYQLIWHPPHHDHEMRVHGELFHSEAFLEAHRNLQDSPLEPGCELPRYVAGMMFWSDATHLTSFGNAKLWPLYVYFGNESKYRRCKPSCNLCTHAAYFQSLPDDFNDFVTQHAGTKSMSDMFYTHCRRKLFHAQWRVLLGGEFIEAYTHGIVITCCDGVKRRFYPRIFTYSADYPEKVLIATVRNLGCCPCPRCLLPKDQIQNIGAEADRLQRERLMRVDNEERQSKILAIRKNIYQKKYAVDNEQHVESLLRPESWVPTSNAFSEKLSKHGFDLFRMLVVDLLHEFELGVWKAVFIHLLRILDSAGAKTNLLAELDYRYRQVPTFGADTIRRFSRNSSEMKKMAARDFEDLLQCAIPVFAGLLPEPHNAHILQLLFSLAHWHALAKLRLHTDETLEFLDHATASLGQSLRFFSQNTCPAFTTKELQREKDARLRREAREYSKKRAGAPDSASLVGPAGAKTARQPRSFNLQTYKLHALGDYASQIRWFGTTDSYSTQTGELEHRTGKRSYTRTSRKSFIPQLARIERRQARIRRIAGRIGAAQPQNGLEDGPSTLDVHHHIGMSQNLPEDVVPFVQRTQDDPAAKDFVLKLKAHLLPRIHEEINGDQAHASTDPPALAQRSPAYGCHGPDLSLLARVILMNERFYRHNIMRINYTSYDVRRAQDVINPNISHHNIMMLAPPGDPHRFCYARVLGIYHANASEKVQNI